VDAGQVDSLKVFADYTIPTATSRGWNSPGDQRYPVFRGEVKAGFTKQGEMIRVINNLAPGIEYGSASTDFGDPAEAVRYAFNNVSRKMTVEESRPNAAASTDLKTVFGKGDWATTAEKMYFPTEPGVAVPAYTRSHLGASECHITLSLMHTQARCSGARIWPTIKHRRPHTTFILLRPNLGQALDSPSPYSPGPTDPTTSPQRRR